jgi:Fur family ferric uptake transcriptional regulator
MTSQLERLCSERGLKMTDQRRVIARVLSESSDHPDVEQVYRRATKVDPRISIATVYRTVKLILDRHDFGDGRARYEEVPDEHHDHLIDVNSGEVIEFCDEEIERLQRETAARLGYAAGIPLGRPQAGVVCRARYQAGPIGRQGPGIGRVRPSGKRRDLQTQIGLGSRP